MNDDITNLAPSDTLDLHNFKPSEVMDLINEFIWSCKNAGIMHGVIIHGKGSGSMRETTHAVLSKNPKVLKFNLGNSCNGQNWGQTSFTLRSDGN